jgi:hypothetical protein
MSTARVAETQAKQAPGATAGAEGEALLGRMAGLRYLIAYPAYSAARTAEEEGFASRLRGAGFAVRAHGTPCPGGWWDFARLDAAWRARDAQLLAAYEALAADLDWADVLIASGGAMLHPEHLAQFAAFKVFVCGDDPESSARLSRPVAPHFDVALTTNVACVGDYRTWGCRDADWIFPPLRPGQTDPSLTEAAIMTGDRPLDVVMLCERVYGASDRAARVERLKAAFPRALVAGPGWPEGPLPDAATYRQAKIGWNLHNSVGPCNSRLMGLPALGVLQVCDNKHGLGRIFALGTEVVGFDDLAECIELTRYYLAHDQERRRIAAAGFRRVHRDYTEARWWQVLLARVAPACLARAARRRTSA